MPHDREDSSVGIPTGLDRRNFLRLGGAAVGATALASSSASASTTRYDIRFSNSVNVVEDYGVDPSGNERVDDVLQDRIEDDTLLIFPPGEYRFEGKLAEYGMDRLGFYGDGDVRFVAPDGFDDMLIDYNMIGEILVEGITLDMTAPNTAAGIDIDAESRAVVEDVTFEGRGVTDNASTANAFGMSMKNDDAVGIIRNVSVEEGGALGHYEGGNGRVGVYVGTKHYGTVRIENTTLADFPNNCVYASKTPGNVEVVDSTFRNNNVAGVRISGEGSFIKNSTFLVDLYQYDGPTEDMNYSFNTRGIWLEQGSYDFPGGALIEGCDLTVTNTDSCSGAIGIASTAKDATIRDTEIRVDQDGTNAIRRKPPEGYGPVTIDNVTITGSADEGQAIILWEADDSVVKNSCLYTPGTNRDGVRALDASGITVKNTNISAGGTRVREDNSDVSTADLTEIDACPVEAVDRKELLIESVGDQDAVDFEATVSGDLQQGPLAEDYDEIEGSTAYGHVANGGDDSFMFTGELTDFDVTFGDASDVRVSIDGEEQVWATGKKLEIRSVGDQNAVDFEATVDGGVERGDLAEDWDDISGGTISGHVANGGVDTFWFTGDLTGFDVTFGDRSDVDVLVDGEQVSWTTSKTLLVESVGDQQAVDFEATVSGEAWRGDLAEEYDYVSGDTIRGHVANGGDDSYQFTGELTDFDVTLGERSDVDVSVDGNPI
jgi:hypothetical protein